jgi:hypothetical protein
MDRRYIAPDGSEIEAWQLTETSRYQDKLWPDWMDSRWFVTIDGDTWLDINGREIQVPGYAWIVYNGAQVDVVPAQAFEAYDKVVKEPPPAEEPTEQPTTLIDETPFDDALPVLQYLWEVGEAGGVEELRDELAKAIRIRTTWCVCAPGECKQQGNRWGCREESPLL